MNLLVIVLAIIAIFIVAYQTYGRFLRRTFCLDENRVTPACQLNDGVDFVPASRPVLLGQHFAAIAAVGPIVGPILAGLAYGWVPGILWIILGAIFIGGVHDFSALIASVRHGAKSIAEIVKIYVGPRAYLLFLLFIWLSLLYVIIVFMDLTAAAFVSPPYGGGVASSSFLYLGLAVLMGVGLYRWKWPLRTTTVIFVPMIILIVLAGQQIPVALPTWPGGSAQQSWDLVILAYCFIASIIPLWVLMQPRGYLGATFLYGTFIAGVIGMLAGGVMVTYPMQLPALLFGFSTTPGQPLPIFPLLFTTIACGACSGFHGIVSSGTTSKQLQKETDAQTVGYGGMLLEGMVAVIAISTVMMLGASDPLLKRSPDEVYAYGLGRFISLFGISLPIGITFAKLAFATFIYDTLDVATRLGRYVFQELTNLKGKTGATLATFATLLFPALSIFATFQDASGKALPLWKMFWPAFGASNQLLAALTLTAVTVWLKKEQRNWLVTALPALFMAIITLWSLVIITSPWLAQLSEGKFSLHPVGTVGSLLILLALYLFGASLRAAIHHR